MFDTTELISSLAAYSESRIQLLEKTELAQANLHQPPSDLSRGEPERSSVLFLRICTAADYFSSDESLMLHVPPVDVDISKRPICPKLSSHLLSFSHPVLDPYILNVLPRSLAPTVGYLVLVAVGSYFLSDIIWNWFRSIGQKSAEPQTRVVDTKPKTYLDKKVT